MKRRGFLTGLTGILAAGAAPAIIHNAMKIVVPKRDIVTSIYGTNLCPEIIGPTGPWAEAIIDGTHPNQIFVERLHEELRAIAYRLYVSNGYAAAAGTLRGGFA